MPVPGSNPGRLPVIGQCSRHSHPCPDCAKELREPYRKRLDRIELTTFLLTLPFLTLGIFTLLPAAFGDPIGPSWGWLWLGLPNLSLSLYIVVKGGLRYSQVLQELNAAEREAGMKLSDSSDELCFR